MEWLKLTIEAVTAIISLVAILKSRKSESNLTVLINKTIHVYEVHHVYEKSNHPKSTTSNNDSQDIAVIFFGVLILLIVGIFLYLRYITYLQTIVAILSLVLCIVGVLLHRKYSVEPKEELRTAYIVTQPLVFSIFSFICFQHYKLSTPLHAFLDVNTWNEIVAKLSSSLKASASTTIILAVYCLCTFAFYMLQIGALSTLLARFYMLYADQPHPLLVKCGISMWAFFPSCASFILFFTTVLYMVLPSA